MASIYGLKRDLQRYYNLRDTVSNMVSNLDNCIDYIERAKSGLESSYTIDGVCADNGKLSGIKEVLASKKSTLSINVINEIDNEISRLNREIEIEEAKKRR